MTSSIDSNVIVALWDKDANNLNARKALDTALSRGRVVVSGAVYAELLGGAGRSIEILDLLFDETGIAVDWKMDRSVWEIAGAAYHGYVARRHKKKDGAVRSMLTDFLIGAHALRHGHRLITMDQRIYKAAFPELEIVYA